MTSIDEPVDQRSFLWKLFESLRWYLFCATTACIPWERCAKVLRASLLLFVFLNVRCSQTQDLASVSSVRTTGFEVRNLNTVVRFHHTSLSKFIKTQVIPYLPKVGKRFVLSTTENYWERKPLSRNNTGKSEVDCFYSTSTSKGFTL